MSLDLDKRQRAMLREMGIRLWQPQPATAEVAGAVAPIDTQKISANVSVSPLTSAAAVAPPRPNTATPTSASSAPPSRRPPVETAPASAAPSNAAYATTGNSAWSLGEARALYTKPSADNGQPAVPGATARWLLLIEAPPAATEADPLAGDTGKLLDNMLRAAGLQHSASAVCVQLSRRGDAATAAPLEAPLAELLKAEKPDVILIMGRLAAQALLQSTEPLGKLRGHVHQLAGVAAVVTYDAAYLLRSLPDKAKAWDDLCRAQHIAQQASS
jgi:uracil-DNA glycosylase family 4